MSTKSIINAPKNKNDPNGLEVITYLLRWIPVDVKAAHYHDDEVHIRQVPKASGLVPKGNMEFAIATIRGLILTVSHQWKIGDQHPQAPETPMRGAYRELFD